MSTGLIIAIIVIAIILVAVFAFVLPRARRTAKVKSRERELQGRRQHVAGENRAEAEERKRHAEMAEQKARMAEQEAKKERAEAELREQKAQMHEKGMADHELIDDHEQDKFAGTSAETTTADGEERPMHEPSSEYEQGAQDEREGRFARKDEPAPLDERRA